MPGLVLDKPGHDDWETGVPTSAVVKCGCLAAIRCEAHSADLTDVTIRYNTISHVGAGLQIANVLSGNGPPLDWSLERRWDVNHYATISHFRGR